MAFTRHTRCCTSCRTGNEIHIGRNRLPKLVQNDAPSIFFLWDILPEHPVEFLEAKNIEPQKGREVLLEVLPIIHVEYES